MNLSYAAFFNLLVHEKMCLLRSKTNGAGTVEHAGITRQRVPLTSFENNYQYDNIH